VNTSFPQRRDCSGANGQSGRGDWIVFRLIGIATALIPELIPFIGGGKTNTVPAEVWEHITSHNFASHAKDFASGAA
jgi:hypothetical protein